MSLSPDNNIFNRTLTNAEKATLILYLVTNGIPDWTDDQSDDLVYSLCALTGMDFDAGQRAFDDAFRFKLVEIERDNED